MHPDREPSARDIHELAAEICTLAGHVNAATHRWLTLIAEFDRRNGWADNATQSCAHWLNWKCGIAMGAAREKVRVFLGNHQAKRAETEHLVKEIVRSG